ncbi:membrane protein [Microbacterium phage Nucci]|nr:membrane protein [Microbacterium phage Nucci]QXO13656.1 membrane protein [Microbacterium phage Mandalorian]
MTTLTDPRTITSFEDLVAAVGADTEPEQEKATPTQATINVMVLMPLLMVFFGVVWALCAAYWWGRYWDEVLRGLVGLIQIGEYWGLL